MYDDVKEYLNWYDTRSDLRLPDDAPIIGLVLQRSHLVTGDEGHYSGVVSEMEARGAKVRPALPPLRARSLLHACRAVHVFTTHAHQAHESLCCTCMMARHRFWPGGHCNILCLTCSRTGWVVRHELCMLKVTARAAACALPRCC